MCWPCLDMAVSCNILLLPSRQVSPPGGKKKYKEVNWNGLNCTGYGGPLISMLFLTLCQLWLWRNARDGFSVFSLRLPLPLITERGWCGGVDWELQSTLFTHSWLFGLAGLRLQGTPTRAHTHTCNMYALLSPMHRLSAKPISILKSPYLCLAHEYSWTMQHSSHLLLLLTTRPLRENANGNELKVLQSIFRPRLCFIL